MKRGGYWDNGSWSANYRFITADGMSYRFGASNFYRNCDYGGNGVCMSDVYVDVNGLKKPNVLGRDVFHLGSIRKTKFLRPNNFGRDQCSNNSFENYKAGFMCFGRIFYNDGWEMKY